MAHVCTILHVGLCVARNEVLDRKLEGQVLRTAAILKLGTLIRRQSFWMPAWARRFHLAEERNSERARELSKLLSSLKKIEKMANFD